MFPRSGGLVRFPRRSLRSAVGVPVRLGGVLGGPDGQRGGGCHGVCGVLRLLLPCARDRPRVMALPMPGGVLQHSRGAVCRRVVRSCVLGAVNYVGVRSGNAVQAVLTVLKVAALAMLPLLALSIRRVDPHIHADRARDTPPGGIVRRRDDRGDVDLRGLVLRGVRRRGDPEIPHATCRAR